MDPLALARRITTLPATIQTTTRQRIARSLEQLRIALDLPSRRELSELTSRLEALDARIASLAAERVAEMTRVVATLTDGQPVADEPAADAAATHEAATAESPTTAEIVVPEAAVAAAAAAGLDAVQVTASATLPDHGPTNGTPGHGGGHRNKKKALKNRR